MLFKIQFNFFKLFPLKDKVTFVISFKENNLFVYREMKKQNIPQEVVFLCEASCFNGIKNNVDVEVLLFGNKNIKDMVKSIYHLATSKHIIIDNYFGFLAATTFKEGVQCTQLWHATGAIKTFGLKDKSVPFRTKRAKERFLRVYNKFNKVIVGSDEMAEIFKEAFNLSENNISYTGIPRTDIFFDKRYQEKKREKFFSQNKKLKNKEIIFYVPTFRDESLDFFHIQLDLEYMYQHLADKYVVLIKLHPAIKHKLIVKEQLDGFVFDYSTYGNVNDLLFITDYLITDYSSIPYEFAILEKPMIFYPYDLEEYQEKRGFWNPYEKVVPGPVAYNTADVVHLIKKNQFDIGAIREYKSAWNKYSLGRSSENVVNSLFQNKYFVKKK